MWKYLILFITLKKLARAPRKSQTKGDETPPDAKEATGIINTVGALLACLPLLCCQIVLLGGSGIAVGKPMGEKRPSYNPPLAQNKGILLANYYRRTPPSLSAHSVIYPLGECGAWPRSFRIKHPGNISTVFLLNISSISISFSLWIETILNYLLNVYMFVCLLRSAYL